MAKIFYLSEIVQFAVEREIESRELYHELAALAPTSTAQELFKLLEQEEKQHETFYQQMLSSLSKEQTPGVKEDDEYLEYMQELIRVNRTVTPLSIEQMQDMKIAVDFAIAREKDAIVFYSGLKNLVQSTDHAMLDRIIREEGKHMARLTKLRYVL